MINFSGSQKYFLSWVILAAVFGFFLFLPFEVKIANADITTGLVVWWKFDEGSGTNAADSSGNGNNGTLGGTPLPAWTGGKIGNALIFDGATNVVTRSNNIAVIDGPSVLSGSVWINPASLPASCPHIISKSDNISTGGWALQMSCSGAGVLFIASDGSGYEFGVTPELLNTNTWAHVAWVYDGSQATDSDKLKIYVDNVPQPLTFQGSLGFMPSSIAAAGAPLMISNTNEVGETHFNGTVDDIRIYNRILTPGDIQELYNAAPNPCAVHDLSSWAWSENIGWISFNCNNQGTGTDYGVDVAADGTMSGYAWSENIGWISFNAADVSGCPTAPCAPTFDKTTGSVDGWAKASSADGNGWDGWIHLRRDSDGDGIVNTDTNSDYGVTVLGCNWDGWAWGGDVVGWIHFRNDSVPYGIIASGDACADPAPPLPSSACGNFALDFDGANDVVDAGSGSSLDDLGPLTVSAWINPRGVDVNGVGTIVRKQSTLNFANAWGLILIDNATCNINSPSFNKAFYFVKLTNSMDGDGKWITASQKCSVSDVIQFDTWQQVVATWDGTQTAAGTRLYRNGAEVSAGFAAEHPNAISSDASYPLYIGNNQTPNRAFDGQIRDVQVYNRVLDPAEVQNLYLGTAASGLVGRWEFPEGSGTQTADSSGNGNTGSLQGGPAWIGFIDSGEDCDGNNLNNATCASLGALGGTLSCSSSCTYDITQCTFPPSAACSDGSDNDGDLQTDYPNDLGCTSANDNNEANQCVDGIDNDADGKTDDLDPGCHLDGNPANASSYSPAGNLESNQIFHEI